VLTLRPLKNKLVAIFGPNSFLRYLYCRDSINCACLRLFKTGDVYLSLDVFEIKKQKYGFEGFMFKERCWNMLLKTIQNSAIQIHCVIFRGL